MADEIIYEEDMPDTGQNATAVVAAPVVGHALSSGLDLIRDAATEIAATDYYTLDELTNTERAREILAKIMEKATFIGHIYNLMRDYKEFQIPLPRFRLTMEAACEILNATKDIAVLEFPERNGYANIFVYSHEGERPGAWMDVSGGGMTVISRALAALGVPQKAQGDREVTRQLRAIARRETVTTNLDIYPFRNGVLDFSGNPKGSFTPYVNADGSENSFYRSVYGRDAHIVAQAGVNYNPGMKLPVYTCNDGMTWDPLTHIHDATGNNPDAVCFILQMLLFGVRGVSGGRSAWFMDGSQHKQGGGGKSVTAELIATAMGGRNTVYMNMEEIATERFGREKIVGKALILGHETSAGQKMIDKSDAVKNLMRNEPITIEQKYKDSFEYTFPGLWIQCMNCEAPKFSDKDPALFRNLVPVYFPQVFADGGKAHTEIKDIFCHDQAAGEYLVNYALEKYGHIKEYDTDAILRLREKIKVIRAAGSTTYDFLSLYLPEAHSTHISVGVLYLFYQAWIRNSGYGQPMGLKAFKREATQWAGESANWFLDHYETTVNIKTGPYALDGWIVDNSVPEYAGPDYAGRIVISKKMEDRRDRDWLVQKGVSAPPAQSEAGRRAYSAYRAAALAIYVDNMAEAHAAGLGPDTMVMTPDQWAASGYLAPEYTAPISDPDGRGLFARVGGSPVMISPAGYLRAMAKARRDPAVTGSWSRFYKAAETVNMHGIPSH